MGLSLGHLVIILLIVLVLFGAGRLPQIMGDLGKGLRSFKDSLKDDEIKKDEIESSKKKKK